MYALNNFDKAFFLSEVWQKKPMVIRHGQGQTSEGAGAVVARGALHRAPYLQEDPGHDEPSGRADKTCARGIA